MYDLLIKNAYIADGSGDAGYVGNLAVDGETIVAVGAVDGEAHRVIDASGLVLAPGFIDPHTHYDAQFAWDALLTTSPAHGVTTVITGNCGVGMAPVRPDMREYLLEDLVNVEAIPYEDLKAGVEWNWSTFPEYMDAMQASGLGINVAPLVALTPIRHYVMGEESVKRAANAEEIGGLKEVLKEAMEAGAFGFSTSILGPHVGYNGLPLASRNASDDEYRALCGVLKELDRGSIETTLNVTREISEEQAGFIELLVNESGRPVTWLGTFNNPGEPGSYARKIRRLDHITAWDKAVPQTTGHPISFQFQLRRPTTLGIFPCFEQLLSLDDEAITVLFKDPDYRQSVRDQVGGSEAFGNNFCGRMTVIDGNNPEVQSYIKSRQTITELAEQAGMDPFDLMFDIALADDLDALFNLEAVNFNAEDVIEVLLDDRLLIGISDAGAHVSMLNDSGYTSYILARWVREAKALTVEHAVHRLTQQPAQFFGIPKRGLIAEGLVADLVLFDLDRVDVAPTEWVYDLPSGGKRLTQGAVGVAFTIVAGQVLYEDGEHSGVLPGQVLRSYDA